MKEEVGQANTLFHGTQEAPGVIASKYMKKLFSWMENGKDERHSLRVERKMFNGLKKKYVASLFT